MKTPDDSVELTLYYDANCPFCLREMRKLETWNRAGKLGFVDISHIAFDPKPLGISMEDLDAALHATTQDGRMLVGLDAIFSAYHLVDKTWLVMPLKVKFLRPPLGYLYRKFAQHRYAISKLLGLRATPQCENGHCEMKHPFFNAKR